METRSVEIYVWIYENEAKGWISRTKRAFFPRQKLSKVDDTKLKRKVSPGFFLLLPVYLPFIAVLSLFFARFLGLEAALELKKSRFNKGYRGWAL